MPGEAARARARRRNAVRASRLDRQHAPRPEARQHERMPRRVQRRRGSPPAARARAGTAAPSACGSAPPSSPSVAPRRLDRPLEHRSARRRRTDARAARRGWIHSTPCRSSGSVFRNGEATPSGWIAEQTSCRKPGSVSSSVRTPPPTCSLALQHEHLHARPRQHDRRGQPVRPGADHDRIRRNVTLPTGRRRGRPCLRFCGARDPRPPRRSRPGRAGRAASADRGGPRGGARSWPRGSRPRAPSVVLSSPLLRARETATPIAEAAGVALEVDHRLAPGAAVDDAPRGHAGRGEPVVVVGHQPDCGEIVARAHRRATSASRPAAPATSSCERTGGSDAVRVRGLRKSYGEPRGRARDRLRDPRRRGVRPARPERRRQDDHRRDPRGLPRPATPARSRCSARTRSAAGTAWRERHRRRAPVVVALREPDPAREPRALRRLLPPTRATSTR